MAVGIGVDVVMETMCVIESEITTWTKPESPLDVTKGVGGTHPPTIELHGNYAVAILEATVRSLSNLDLFRSNACWRQSSKLVQL